MNPRGSSLTYRTFARRLAIGVGAFALVLGVLPTLTGAKADDWTASSSAFRTSWDGSESAAMSPGTVATFSPSPRINLSVKGQVYGQPLVIDSLNLVIVATEEDYVYGITATGPNAGHLAWPTDPVSLGKYYPIGSACGDLTPNIGVTGTPVYNSNTGKIYMFANIEDPTANNYPKWYMVSLNASDGTGMQKVHIGGHPSNDSGRNFLGAQQMERPGVLLAQDGSIWGAFGSHCDHKPYVGYVVRVDPSSSNFSLWTDETGTADDQAGIWDSGGGLMQDSQGRIFTISGNGVSPPKTDTVGGNLAESTIALTYSSGHIKATDFFSGQNATQWDSSDTDFGSGGPTGVPFATQGSHTYSDMMLASSKSSWLFVLNRNNLGGREQGSGGTDNVLGKIKTGGGEWSHEAVFADQSTLTPSNAGSANNYVFNISKNSPLQVFKFGVTSDGHPTLSTVSNSSLTYGFGSGSPVVTSTGTDPTTAVVWVVSDPNGSTTGSGSELNAYKLWSGSENSGHPSSTLPSIWHSTTFAGSKFCIPATSNGWVYVGTRDNRLLGWAAPTTSSPVTGAVTGFPQTAVGTSVTKDVSITAQHPITVAASPHAITDGSNAQVPTSQYAAGTVSLQRSGSKTPVPVTSYPVNLATGDKLIASVTLTPASPGTVNGHLSFPVSGQKFPAVSVALTGDGTVNGLTGPSSVAFPLAPDQGVINVPVGISRPESAIVTNYGTTTQTVTSVTPPAAPFSATGLPSVGSQVKPGQSLTVSLNYAPARAVTAQDSGSFTITSTDSAGTHTLTVTLLGSPTAAVSHYTVMSPPATATGVETPAISSAVSFGSVKVGTKATTHIYVANTGNTATTVTGTAALPKPFGTPLTATGLALTAGDDFTLPVTFAPTHAGTFVAHYVLTWRDVNGSHTLTVTITGTGV